MKAEIITIGDELLIGQVVDTNSAWMAQQLNLAGISVKQISSVSDDRQHILTALKEAEGRAGVILITGGLGPTKDDITKNTLCEYFNTSLVFNQKAYDNVERLFSAYGKQVTPVNRKQAEVPANSKMLLNVYGTAPGMWFEEKGKVYVSMPGVPYEMKYVMSEWVIPMLKEKFSLSPMVHRTVLTQGIGESFLAAMIEGWEDSLAAEGIKLAYLPSPGMVRLRLSATGDKEGKMLKRVEAKIEELKKLAPQYIYGVEDASGEPESLEKIIGELLRKKKATLSTAESCTGGYIAHLVTSIAGSSDYFKGSVISYANEIKTGELGVKAGDIAAHGAVSQQVAEQMAAGIRKKYQTTYAVAVSGIAGPGGGTEEKPVGTVWIAVATPEKVYSAKHQFGNNRERNIRKTALAALAMLRTELL